MSILAPATSFIWQAIESYGLDPGPYFARHGVDLHMPPDPQARFPTEVFDQVRAAVIEDLGIETFGLRIAEFLHPSHFGALGYAWLASSSLRSALNRLSNYIKLFNEDSQVLVKEVGHALLISDHISSKSMNYAARDDTSLAILVQLCRFNCGNEFKPDNVLIRHKEPADPQPWFEFFGCPVHFNAPVNQFQVSLEIADRKLSSANSRLALINDQLIARDIAKLETRDVIAKVRAVITGHLASGSIKEEYVANAIQMTVRTMHRKLSGHGTNFSAELAQVREDLARRYLADSGLTLIEIAFLLGFSQASSFSRAYLKWTGEPPSETRRKMTNRNPAVP